MNAHTDPVEAAASGSRIPPVWRDWASALVLLWRTSPSAVTLLIVCTVLQSALPAAQIALLATAVDAVADALTLADPQQAASSVLAPGILLAAVLLAAHLLAALNQYVSEVLQLKLGTVISERLMTVGTQLELSDYEDAESYDKLQRASQESSGGGIQQLFESLLEFARELLTLVSVGAVLIIWNPWIALLVLLAPIPAAAANMWIGATLYSIEYDRAADRRRLTYLQFLTTTDHTFKEVRLFGLGRHLIGQYRELVQTFLSVDRRMARRQALLVGGLGILSVVCTAAAIVVALLSTLSTGSLGELAGYLQALTTVQMSATALLMSIGTLFQLSLFLGNLFTVFRLPRPLASKGGRPFPSTIHTGFEFRDVSFTYPGTDRVVLDRVSFDLPSGRCVAMVGSNGSGKTSIVKLLTRLYEATSGEILLDGVPIQEYDLTEYQAQVSVIFQDFIRYEMPIRANIGFGRIDDLDDTRAIKRAANQAGLTEEIEAMEQGFETMLGRHFVEGRQLSGGQWQRVALARAFVRDAPVIVLDEPTAAIDAEAEERIFTQFREVTRGRLSVLIAHRFATVRLADSVIVIESGRIEEVGTHSELLARNGRYAHLFRLQASGYWEDSTPAERAEVPQ